MIFTVCFCEGIKKEKKNKTKQKKQSGYSDTLRVNTKNKKKNKEKKKEGHEVLPPVPGGQGLNGRMRKRQ